MRRQSRYPFLAENKKLTYRHKVGHINTQISLCAIQIPLKRIDRSDVHEQSPSEVLLRPRPRVRRIGARHRAEAAARRHRGRVELDVVRLVARAGVLLPVREALVRVHAAVHHAGVLESAPGVLRIEIDDCRLRGGVHVNRLDEALRQIIIDERLEGDLARGGRWRAARETPEHDRNERERRQGDRAPVVRVRAAAAAGPGAALLLAAAAGALAALRRFLVAPRKRERALFLRRRRRRRRRVARGARRGFLIAVL